MLASFPVGETPKLGLPRFHSELGLPGPQRKWVRPSPSAKTAPKAVRPSNRGEALQRPQQMVDEVLNLYSESDQPGERRVSQDPAGLCYRASARFHGAQVHPRSPRTADTWKTATTATDWPAPAAPPHSKSQVTFSRFRACCEVCEKWPVTRLFRICGQQSILVHVRPAKTTEKIRCSISRWYRGKGLDRSVKEARLR